MTSTASTRRVDVSAIFRPRQVAIVGMSAKPGSAGHVVLGNLRQGGFEGPVHLVGRSGGEVAGTPVLTGIDRLPDGVDLAILMVPADAVLASVEACIARGVRGAVCFASGFAEMGPEGRDLQEHIAGVARAGGLALLGPNTVGYFNYVDAFQLIMVEQKLAPRLEADAGPAVAVVAQSGGIGAHLAASLRMRGVPLSYMMTTGNEAQLGLAEMIAFFAEDARTGAIVVYAEQVRSAPDFLAAVRRARECGKPVVMLHPGRSERSQAAAQSHTGALAGNHAAMQLMVEQAGVVTVDTLEEAIDLGQILLRYPQAPTGGLGLVTASGALCGIAQDYLEPLGLDIPALSAAQAERLREHLPAFTPPRNPLDLGTLVAWKPELITLGIAALLADEAVGSVLVSVPFPGPATAVQWLGRHLDGIEGSRKPGILVMHNEDEPLSQPFVDEAQRRGAIVMRSPERALRALARLTRYGRAQAARAGGDAAPAVAVDRAALGLTHGTHAEWVGKKMLRALGVPTPAGALATTVDEGLRIAAGIGYPVVLKAQAAQLAHKSEAGGVLLNIADEPALRAAWQRLHDNVARADAGLRLDGVLVETMGARGLELVVGATRDPQWGPILMIGLGGIWVEALGDVKLLAPGLPRAAIVEQLRGLKAAKLLDGFRGSAPVDLDAVADVVARVGQLMQQHPEVLEIDINPLVAYEKGQGVVALDALVVTR